MAQFFHLSLGTFLEWTAIGAGQVLLMTLVLAVCGSLRLRRQRPASTPSRLWSTNPVVMEPDGPTWLTGGEAGPESGIAETLVLALAVVALCAVRR